MKNATGLDYLKQQYTCKQREVADLKLTGQQNVSILQQAQLHRYVLDKVCVTYLRSARINFQRQAFDFHILRRDFPLLYTRSCVSVFALF